uniref:Uncharacterized protein n=1 Tax=Oryctolagus cuniculus TaxID=9986 RepID=A0A5F9DAG4_RABIT
PYCPYLRDPSGLGLHHTWPGEHRANLEPLLGAPRASPANKTAPAQARPAPVIWCVYRPTGARLTTTRKMPQGPPEIHSDTQFPSLQSTAKHVESQKDKELTSSWNFSLAHSLSHCLCKSAFQRNKAFKKKLMRFCWVLLRIYRSLYFF